MDKNSLSKLKTSELIIRLVQASQSNPGPGRQLRLGEKLSYFEKQSIEDAIRHRKETIEIYSEEIDRRFPSDS